MPDEPEPPTTVADTLRALIAQDPRTLRQLALDADAPYQVIQKWSRKETAKLDVDIAAKLYQTLTGKAFGDVK